MPKYCYEEYIRITGALPDYVERDIFCIPFVEADEIDISKINNGIWLESIKNVSGKDKMIHSKIIHGFKNDDVLVSEYQKPFKLLKKLGNCYAAATPDYSMCDDSDFVHKLNAVYLSRWIGVFLQAHGIKVIPTVGWTNDNEYNLFFAGLRNKGVFMISTLGVNNDSCRMNFLNGYNALRTKFPDVKIISLGDRIKGMDDDVCYVKYEESFGNLNCRQLGWQPKMFNWDLSLAEGVC